MGLKVIRFLRLFFTALALGPGLAHLLELANKIDLSREEYLTVQQIYRGWALLGIVIVGALVSTLILTIMVRDRPRVFWLTLLALLCLAGSQVIFWTYTFPANQATSNWTYLPANWEELRREWEYSHAAGASLVLIAMASLILSLLVRDEPRVPRESAVRQRQGPESGEAQVRLNPQ